MRLPLSQIRFPIEFAFLALLILFLPSFEAPKNIFWAAYVITWVLNRIQDKDFGGKWGAWDTLIVVWIASGYIVAVFAGFQYHEWSGANDIVRYGSILWLVMRSRFSRAELIWLLAATVVATLLALAEGLWSLLVAHRTGNLQLHSVGHVNHSAIYLAIVYGASLYAVLAFWHAVRPVWRSVLAAVTLVLTAALVIAESRAALGVALIFTFLTGLVWLKKSRWPFIIFLGGVLAVVAGAYFLRLPIALKQEQGMVANMPFSLRPEIWRVAIEAWRHYPWFGVGMGNYGKIEVPGQVQQWLVDRGEIFDPERYAGQGHAHSLYFNTLAERGLFGLAIILGILGYWAYQLYRRRPAADSEPLRWALWGGAFSAWFNTVVIGTFNTTLHHEHAILSLLLVGFWLSYESYLGAAEHQADRTARAASQPRILVIRRDNIGDLVCTTPVFTALRQYFPDACLCALVASYNRAVLDHNPDLDAVFAYTKLKHRAPGQPRLRPPWQRLRMHRELKKIAFDYVLLPNDQPRLLHFALGLRPRRIIALGGARVKHEKITMLTPIREGSEHEVQATYRLLEPLGIHGAPPAVSIMAGAAEIRAALDATGRSGSLVAIHISARKPSQRWPAGRYTELMRALHTRHGVRFLLLWSPGPEVNPLHPGDDEKAQVILRQAGDLPVLPYATHTLPALTGALSICDAVICSDGGAMHLAAGLGKPIVCLFGKSDAWRWHPWGVPYELLQAVSLDVADISADEVLDAYGRLRKRVETG